MLYIIRASELRDFGDVDLLYHEVTDDIFTAIKSYNEITKKCDPSADYVIHTEGVVNGGKIYVSISLHEYFLFECFSVGGVDDEKEDYVYTPKICGC